MSLRAADKKDEHGWQILDEDDNVVAHAPSRDKARLAAKNGFGARLIESVKGEVEGVPPGARTVLSPEAMRRSQVIAEVDPILKESYRPHPDKRSPEEIAADNAREVDSRIRQNMTLQKALWVQLAADLYLFHKGRMWDALGYASFSAYVADADTDMEPRWAYNLLEMYTQLVIERGVDPDELKELHVTKVRTVLPAVRREQVTLQEAFADVKALPKRDLETKYKGTASPTPGKPDTSSTIHTGNEPTYMRCPTCGSRVELDPETGEPKGST